MESTGEAVFGKIMLFGEYGILSQGRALTIPLKNFSGTLRFPDSNPNERQAALNKLLFAYHDYLSARERAPDHFGISLRTFEKELKEGLYFDSDIPSGYGAGSSGALVAAVYRRFGLENSTMRQCKNFQDLQENLAALEAYFHGTSSGIDPLSCFLGVPLEFSPTGGARVVNLSKQNLPEKAGFFLVDSGFPRKTGELVKLFSQKSQEEAFKIMMQKGYNATVSSCIDSVLSGDFSRFQEALKHLSGLQYNHFSEMIPDGLLKLWEHGLMHQQYTLKLCGAGGGGFILGFTGDVAQLQKIGIEFPVIEITL
jgi:mevalonate kinase